MSKLRRLAHDVRTGWREGRRESTSTRKPEMFPIVNASFAVGIFLMGAAAAIDDGGGWIVAAWALGAVGWGALAFSRIRNAARYVRLAETALTFSAPIFRDLHETDVDHIDMRITRGEPGEWNATRTTYVLTEEDQ